jgi:hypothetical protein
VRLIDIRRTKSDGEDRSRKMRERAGGFSGMASGLSYFASISAGERRGRISIL